MVTEVSAYRLDEWITRAALLLMQSGVDVGDAVSGRDALMRSGFTAFLRLPYAETKPLLDEMMTCVSVRPDPRNPVIEKASYARPLMPQTDVEEVSTFWTLRKEVFELHMGKSWADVLSTSTTDSDARPTQRGSSNTGTSRQSSAA